MDEELLEKAEAYEQFGDDWSVARAVLSELEDFGIYMLDPSPSNICFR